jgi:predicted GNAT family acetyltransferase
VERHRQIILWVDQRVRGQGYAVKIVKALEQIAFSDTRYSVLFYTHDIANVASRRVAEKCMFEFHCNFNQTAKALHETGSFLCWAKDNPLLSE